MPDIKHLIAETRRLREAAITRESKCPLCGSCMTDYHDSYSDGDEYRQRAIDANICTNRGCGLPVRLWKKLAGANHIPALLDYIEGLEQEVERLNRLLALHRRGSSKVGNLFVWCVENIRPFPPMEGEWTDKVKSMLLQLPQWQQFASYCRSCALSGESNPQTFEEFINQLQPRSET